MGHIELSRHADAIVVAPASADFIAKLDGSAKAGFVFAIKDQLNIPVRFIGLGETPQDIETFDPQRFVDALFGEPPV
jgi:fused signal recognition particle receptor